MVLIIAGCGGAPKQEPAPQLPHLRYFESFPTDNERVSFTLYDYNLNDLSRSTLWHLEDSKINRVELTPDGRFVLVHYVVIEELSQYYVVYDLENPTPSIPLTFTRGESETQRISAYQAFLDDGVYKLGFVIGDPDFKVIAQDPGADVYQFAWVDLGRRYVEDIPLVTTMDQVPDIIFVDVGGGFFDFVRKGTPEIVRFDWETKDTSKMKDLYDPKREPILQVQYIGSFSYFADFEKPSRSGQSTKPARVGIRTPDSVIPLVTGDFPLWSLGDIYIFIRVFPKEVMEGISLGVDPDNILKAITESKEGAKFAVYDLVENERRDISLTLQNKYALPHPIYDVESGILATTDRKPVESNTEDEGDTPATGSIVVFDIEKNIDTALLTGIPSYVNTSIAFYRPKL